MQRFIKALNKLELFNKENDTSGRDMIVYADYEKSNRDRMARICEILGLGHRLRMFDNGQQVVDYFVQVLA